MLITYAYDPLSRRDSATRSSVNGAATDYAFDNASRLTTLAHDFSGGATNDQSYGFTYTAASQLQQRTASNDNYTWPISAIDRDYNRNGLNQYTTTTGTGATTFTHDARGNLISDGVRRFCYDLENRLLRVDDHADTSCSTPALTLSYDPLGRLHQSSAGMDTRQFLYDGDALIAEYTGSDISRRFVHGPGVDEPVVQYDGSDLNTRIHLFADRQGSIIATNGATTNTYRYGPYGETDVWAGSRFRYTGQAVFDPNLGTSTPVALYHYKARVYDPVLGRFLQTDPVGYEEDLNLYAYVRNDPINAFDANGREAGDVFQRFMPSAPPTKHLGQSNPGTYATPDAAAAAAIQNINPRSIAENREYGGRIRETPTGEFYATRPVTGSSGSVTLPPLTSADRGDYHTHGDYSTQDAAGNIVRTTQPNDTLGSDQFSGGDRAGITNDAANASAPGYSGYLGTPSQSALKFDPSTGQVTPLPPPPPPPPPRGVS